MSIKLKSGNGPVLRAPQRSDVGGSVSHDWVTVQTSGGTTTAATRQDANFLDYTGATYHREGGIFIEGLGTPEIVNLDPTVGSVASDGTITRLSPGIVRLRVKTPLVTLPLELDLRDKDDEADQPNQFVSTVAGSLSEHLQAQIDSRINSSMTMGVNGLFYNSDPYNTGVFTRNPDVWCADVDRTCISPWNSEGIQRQAGTLITPRHVLTVIHSGYDYNLGAKVRFISQDGNNTVYERTVVGKKHPLYDPPYSPDLAIHTLDEDLPANVTPCKVMPSNWNNYLVHNFYTHPPALGLDQEEKALIIDFWKGGSFLTPIDADRLIFDEDKISGDSGNPAFLIFNGELVLVTLWSGGGAGSGSPVAAHIATLNQMIVDADTQAGVSGVDDPTWPNANGHYQVKEADFSAFPNYAS